MTRPAKAIDLSTIRHLYPFKSHFLRVDGLRYHYLDQGQGEPLIMVHGNPTWSFYFRNLVTALSDRYRVIAPDHIGCGLSEKPEPRRYGYRLKDRVADLGALIDHLKLSQPVTLVLHDWGGMIGLAWAATHLDCVARLIIFNTAGFFPPRGKAIPWRLRIIRKPNRIVDRLVLDLNLFARAAVYMAPRSRLSAQVKTGLLAPYNCPANRVATLKFVRDIPLCTMDPSGPTVACVEQALPCLARLPALILWGQHDFVFDRDYYDEWRRRFPQAEAHLFEQAGHYVLEDIPAETVALIRQFLRKHPMG
jgi:haloalkane dehalogenase